MSSNKKLISLIVPAYNEEENLPILFDRLNGVLAPLEERYRFEVIVLDNGSEDRTREIASGFSEKDPKWKYVRYSRNFGYEASLLAGLDFSSGDAAINLSSDLQEPPELIPELIAKWEEGYDMVYGSLRKRSDYTWMKTLSAKVGYWMIYHLTDCKITPNATDYRLMNRAVIDVLRELREPDRYMRGLVHWIGFNSVGIPYDRAERERGKTTADVFYLVKFGLHAIVCFSSKPLHLVTLFGLIITGFSVLFAGFSLIQRFFPIDFWIFSTPNPGITTIILLLLFMIGLNSLFLGVIGEYVGRIYNQGKRRPVYVVREKVNIERPGSDSGS